VLQGGAGEPLQLLVLTEDSGRQRLRHDQHLGGGPRDDVGDGRVHGHRRVGDQGPGRRGPDEKGGAQGLQRAAGDREPDVDARVDDGLVALRDLVVGQPGAAARAVRRHPMVLHQQALVVDLLQRPPHRLDVARVHRPVGLVGVHPVRHAAREVLELTDVPHHGLAAPRVELRDAVGLDVALAREPELLLDGQLHGEAVAVPAALARYVTALHGLEPREQVLEYPRLDVVGAGLAVRGRRPLVEHPGLAVLGLLEAPGEDVVALPAGQDLVLERGQVDLSGELLHATGCHVGAPSSWCSDEGTRSSGSRGTTLLEA
jgi:hypothetical protein